MRIHIHRTVAQMRVRATLVRLVDVLLRRDRMEGGQLLARLDRVLHVLVMRSRLEEHAGFERCRRRDNSGRCELHIGDAVEQLVVMLVQVRTRRRSLQLADDRRQVSGLLDLVL